VKKKHYSLVISTGATFSSSKEGQQKSPFSERGAAMGAYNHAQKRTIPPTAAL